MTTDIRENLNSAIQSLRMNMMRSGLTMLGIIIGVSAVIMIASIGQGTVAFISNELTSFGTNFFQINPGSDMMSAFTGGEEPLTTADVKVIQEANIPNIKSVAAFSFTSRVIYAKNESVRASIYGMTTEVQDMLKPEIMYGELLAEDDLNSRVVVLGTEVAEDLFGRDVDPVGEAVKIGDVRFLVIGVTKSGGTLFGSFFNTAVSIPLETLQHQITGKDELTEIDVEVTDTALIEETMNEVETVLKDHRNVRTDEEIDFTMTSFDGAMTTFNTITSMLTLFITGISAISLLVGGVGVMNIMLVSVTERTKEIGLLKAIGAKRRDILGQFLIESAVMTTIGGAAGILVGIGGTAIVAAVAGIPLVISVPWIVLAVGISTLVGLVFGWYPAKKAASLHPIDALRFE